MARQKRGPIQNMAALFGALLKGKTLTSASAAQLIATNEPAARPYLDALSQVDGIVAGSTRARSVRLERSSVEEGASDAEAVAANLGAALHRIFLQTAYSADLRRLRDKTLRRAGVSEEELENADRKFVFLPRGAEIAFDNRAGDFDQVILAIRTNRKLRFVYSHYDGSEEKVTIDPYTLALYEHQFYVVGRSGTARPGLYRFARMREVDCLTKSFSYPSPSAYSPDKFFADSFGVFVRDDTEVQRVTIRLSGHLARYAETHQWHRSQELLPGEVDGVTILRLRVRICAELVSWILGLGSEALVVEPAELRDRVASIARKIVSGYSAASVQSTRR